MCKEIEIELDDDAVENLRILTASKLRKNVDDCSYEWFVSSDVSTIEKLHLAAGQAIVNSVLTDALDSVISNYDQEDSDG